MAIAGEGTLGPCLNPSGGEGGSPRVGGGCFNETGAGGGGGVPSGGRGYKYMYWIVDLLPSFQLSHREFFWAHFSIDIPLLLIY
jgi:hypothetical protein